MPVMGKVLGSTMFASRAGALVSPRRPLGLPHAAKHGRVLAGGSGVPVVPLVCVSSTAGRAAHPAAAARGKWQA